MIHTFSDNISPRLRNGLSANLIISSSTPKEALLIRLLTGTLKIKNVITSEEIAQQFNYSKLGREYKSVPSLKPIRESLTTPLKIYDLDSYLLKTNHVNDSYYIMLLEEYCSYFISSNRQSHTKAFLHLYRIIEFISYSFPLIYSSYSRDYFGTFNKLKNYFDTSKTELLFFESFTDKVLDNLLLDAELEIDFTSLPSQLAKNYYVIIKNYIDSSKLILDVTNVKLSFQYRHFIKLIIDLRNRYFHFAVGGQRNIKSSEILESDYFFKLINEEIINWISVIYFEILNHCISQSKS